MKLRGVSYARQSATRYEVFREILLFKFIRKYLKLNLNEIAGFDALRCQMYVLVLMDFISHPYLRAFSSVPSPSLGK